MRNARLAILRKGFNSAITLVLVVILNFFLFRVIPGNPLSHLRDNPRLSDEFKEKMVEQFGLDQPIHVQFVEYMKNVFVLDFGNSFNQPLTPALDIILGNLKYTLILTGTSSILMIVIGMSIGVIAAWKRGSKFDTGSMAYSHYFYAMPTIWFAIRMSRMPAAARLSASVSLAQVRPIAPASSCLCASAGVARCNLTCGRRAT